MTREMRLLTEEIDSFLRDSMTIGPIERELIIRLKDHMIGQDRIIKRLLDDRERHVLIREET